MAGKKASVDIAKHVTDRKIRHAIEQAAIAFRDLADQQAAARADKRRESDELMSAIMRPLTALVSQDPAAARALAGLKATVGKDELSLGEPVRPFPGMAAPLSLASPFDLKGPPYDSTWNRGNDEEHSSDASTGYIEVLGDSGSRDAA